MIGVLLLNFGGPSSNEPAVIAQYIYNILSDRANWPWAWARAVQPRVARAIARKRADAVAAQYAAMGGASPLLRWSTTQMSQLETALRPVTPNRISASGAPGAGRSATGLKFFLGMQYWAPFIEDVLPTVAAEPLTDLILLPLYPHVSVTTSTACCERVEHWWQRHGNAATRLHRCDGWYTHPRYIAACAALLQNTLAQFADPASTHILFTAHSLPQRTVDQGDVYPHQIRAHIHQLLAATRLTNSWSLGYQSKLGPIQWLEPSVESAIHAYAERGGKALCLMPLSFVSDMLETLYEVDVTYMKEARALGIPEVRRVPVMNDHPMFIECLKEVVLAHVPTNGHR